MRKAEKLRILSQIEKFTKDFFTGESSGHDWWHIYRVRNLALKIAREEGGDLFQIEMAALLHDLEDWKLKSEQENPGVAGLLEKAGVSDEEAAAIQDIISRVSFRGAGVETAATSLEAKVVQDADRLDAIGAIGVARAFAYGGSRNRLIYHPDIKPVFHAGFEEYRKGTGPTINHFYEKLLLLKDRLNTKTAIKMADKRHRFLEEYLTRFFEEWENKS